jgi:hypothetical protein
MTSDKDTSERDEALKNYSGDINATAFDREEAGFRAGWDARNAEVSRLKAGLASLAKHYEPHDDCADNDFICDYRPAGCESCNMCPCEIVGRFNGGKTNE